MPHVQPENHAEKRAVLSDWVKKAPIRRHPAQVGALKFCFGTCLLGLLLGRLSESQASIGLHIRDKNGLLFASVRRSDFQKKSGIPGNKS